MKHFAVPAPDGTLARPARNMQDGEMGVGAGQKLRQGRGLTTDAGLPDAEPVFDAADEDGMTQQGFKKFRRRNTKARQQADQGAEQDTGPVTEPTPRQSDAADRYISDEAEQTPAPPVQPEQRARGSKPAATSTVSDTSGPDTSDATRPLRTQKRPLLQGMRDVLMAEAPPADLPAPYDPWLQIPKVPFDFLGQKPTRLPLVSAFRASPTARAFDLLRTRLLHSLKAHGWKRVAVTSPTAGGGTTFCAVNLALSLARVPHSRTLLMDMNFHRPGLAAALGIPPHGDMAAFLAGEVPFGQHLQRLSETLAVGCNCSPDHNASDILHDRRTADVISDLIAQTEADTVLFDLPPVLEHDDVTAFLPQVDGVLLISDGDQTTAAQLAACEKMLAGHAPLLGVVLNRAQQSDKTQVTP